MRQALSVSRVICGTKVYQSPRQPLLPIVSEPPWQLPAQAIHRLTLHLLCPALAEVEVERRTDQRVFDSIGMLLKDGTITALEQRLRRLEKEVQHRGEERAIA